MSTLTLQSTATTKIFDYTSDDETFPIKFKEEPKWEDDLFNNDLEDLSENFADKMLDLEFMYLDNCGNSTSSPKISFPTVTSRKRPCPSARVNNSRGVVVKREKRFLSDYRPLRISEDDQYIDIVNDNTETKWEHTQVPSQGTPQIKVERVEQPDFIENYKPYHRDQHYNGRSYEFTHYNNRSLYREATRTDDGELSPKEQMTLLRSGCTCQARNTGKSTHLWEFLLEMLADKRMRSVIAWTGHAREFKVVNSREVAREWGNRKNKPHMNFDKMSRAMRYYYKKKILTHGSKQRLVYSFCHHAICPHYEKIINLALRTRPKLHETNTATQIGSTAPNKDSSSPPPQRTQQHFEQRRTPKVKTPLSQKYLSEKFLTAKLSSYRLNRQYKKHPPQRPIGSTLTRPTPHAAGQQTWPAQRPIGSTMVRPTSNPLPGYTTHVSRNQFLNVSEKISTPVRERNIFSHPFLNKINSSSQFN